MPMWRSRAAITTGEQQNRFTSTSSASSLMMLRLRVVTSLNFRTKCRSNFVRTTLVNDCNVLSATIV